MNKSGKKEKTFELKPFIQLNERIDNVAEPATKHFFSHEIYLYSHYMQGRQEKKQDDQSDYQEPKMQVGHWNTFVAQQQFVILEGLNKDLDKETYHLRANDLAVGAKLN